MPLGRHRRPVGQPGGEHGPLPERRAPADREAAGLGRRGRVAAQGWPPVRGRVLIKGVVAVPWGVGAFRRDEYAGLLRVYLLRAGGAGRASPRHTFCVSRVGARDEETLFGLTCRAHFAAE